MNNYWLQKSTIFMVMILCVHVGAGIAVGISAINALIKIFLWILLGVSLRSCLSQRRKIIGFEVSSAKVWRIYTADKGWVSVDLQGSSSIRPFLSILNFKSQTGRQKISMVLFADHLNKEQWLSFKRRLFIAQ